MTKFVPITNESQRETKNCACGLTVLWFHSYGVDEITLVIRQHETSGEISKIQ